MKPDVSSLFPDRLETLFAAGKPRALVDDSSKSAAQSGAAPRLQSRQLFGNTNELLIEHAGFTYRLRITQANKLILTK